MTEIPSITNIQDITGATNVAGKSNLGKEDFLNLLVTQLRYQDPMEPMQDSDFVAQLAQFSSLEQLSNINTSLDYSTQLDYILSQTIANTMATTIIGKEVVADGNSIYHQYETDSRLHFDLDADARDVEINIYDKAGTLVRTITEQDLDSGKNYIVWDGKDNSGSNVAGGEYTFDVEAKDAEGEPIGANTRLVGIVESVRYEDGKGYLIVGGQQIDMSDILEINLPSDSGEESGGSEQDENPLWD